MSGSHVTYAMNTITRTALMILQAAQAKGRMEDTYAFAQEMMRGKHYGGTISGDDEATIGELKDTELLSKSGWILHEVGFPRKDMIQEAPSSLSKHMEEIEFCSHNYIKVSYYDESSGDTCERWCPTRSVTEIMAKATIRLGTGDELSEEAWLSAQGNQLLVNYHHMRTPRAAGFAFKAIVNPNLLLTDKGGFLKPTPWMREGDILEVLNTVLFGDGTKYPKPRFKVRQFRHIGYSNPRFENVFDPNFNDGQRRKWRQTLHYEAQRVVTQLSTGGDVEILNQWRSTYLH